MDSSIVKLIEGVGIAAATGVLTGLFGIGGGFLMTPLMVIVLGVPAGVAVGTGLSLITLNGAMGLAHRRGTGTVDGRLGALASCGSLCGVWVGQRLMIHLQTMPPITVLGREQNTLEYSLMAGFLVVLGGLAAFMYHDLRVSGGVAPERRVGWFARHPWGPRMGFASLEEPLLPVAPLLLVGGAIGILTGLMGIGGGILWLPALVYLAGQRAAKAAGTSLLVAWLSSLFGAGLNVLHGNIDVPLCAAMLVGGIAGTAYGTKVGLQMAGPKLRRYFIVILVASALLIAWKLISMTLET